MHIIKHVYLECRIFERNRHAFYTITAGHDLFGWTLIRHWGRIGTKGQPKLRKRFTTEEAIRCEFGRVLEKRYSRQYRRKNTFS